MTYIVVDVEADGPCPGLYSMTELGAVVVRPGLTETFYAQLRPISNEWVPEALAVSKRTRAEVLNFPHPSEAMRDFGTWVRQVAPKRAFFVSDNNGFDWQWVNWYFHKYEGSNPFGFSSTNLGSLYKGLVKDVTKNFKHLRKTPHTHNPVDDAKGNAEALLALREMGLRFPLK